MAAVLVGARLEDIQRREHDWAFVFDRSVRLQVTCYWRIISEGRLALSDSDDGQKFGLPAPVDAELRSKELLLGRPIQQIAIREDTGDLSITIAGDVSLEILNNSSGYEGWEMRQLPHGKGFQVIAMGGGNLAVWGMKLPEI